MEDVTKQATETLCLIEPKIESEMEKKEEYTQNCHYAVVCV